MTSPRAKSKNAYSVGVVKSNKHGKAAAYRVPTCQVCGGLLIMEFMDLGPGDKSLKQHGSLDICVRALEERVLHITEASQHLGKALKNIRLKLKNGVV